MNALVGTDHANPPRRPWARELTSFTLPLLPLGLFAVAVLGAASAAAAQPPAESESPLPPMVATPPGEPAPPSDAAPAPDATPDVVLPQPSGTAAEHFRRASELARGGDHAGALADFEAALVLAPDNLRYGAEYRQSVIAVAAYDRSLAFFAKLVELHPTASNLWLNYGYAYVDKIPVAGAITQVILANTALGHFSRSLELKESWLGLYTRGNSYLYWPKIFGRTPLGLADLEKAVAMARQLPARSYHALAWASLGDSQWRQGDAAKAHAVWQEGLQIFPGDERLTVREGKQGEELDAFLEAHFATDSRVGTDLRELWAAGWREACDCDPEAR